MYVFAVPVNTPEESRDVRARRPNTDGRVARGQRSRGAIIAAHAALLREGNLKPTAKQIAERAGVSVRTLWLNFKDLESLLSESTAYWLADDDALWQPIDPGLPLEDRIARFCDQRSRRLENIAPAARAAALGEPFSPVLQASRRRHVQRVRRDVETAFAPELGQELPGRDRLVNGIAVAASWPAWQMLRDDLEIAAAEATAIMRNTIGILLGL